MHRASDAALTARYLAILRSGSTDDLRALVLLSGLPSNANALAQPPNASRCSLRGLVWKALLCIGPLDPHEYPTLVRKGPSADDHRVREDARRTFSKNDDFCARVPNAKIIRVLNAYVHAAGNTRGIYAQSMALLAAPFLYVMPEPDAFHCFRVFLTQHVQLYVKRYAGARRGCHLLDRCLADVDPQLHQLFTAHKLNAEVYAFPSISSLGACVQPMSDTVRLWDIQLAYGAHMHVIFTLARLLLASSSIIEASRRTSAAPLITRELEQGLGLDADTVIARAVPLLCQLNTQLYEELVVHASESSHKQLRDFDSPAQTTLANDLECPPNENLPLGYEAAAHAEDCREPPDRKMPDSSFCLIKSDFVNSIGQAVFDHDPGPVTSLQLEYQERPDERSFLRQSHQLPYWQQSRPDNIRLPSIDLSQLHSEREGTLSDSHTDCKDKPCPVQPLCEQPRLQRSQRTDSSAGLASPHNVRGRNGSMLFANSIQTESATSFSASVPSVSSRPLSKHSHAGRSEAMKTKPAVETESSDKKLTDEHHIEQYIVDRNPPGIFSVVADPGCRNGR